MPREELIEAILEAVNTREALKQRLDRRPPVELAFGKKGDPDVHRVWTQMVRPGGRRRPAHDAVLRSVLVRKRGITDALGFPIQK